MAGVSALRRQQALRPQAPEDAGYGPHHAGAVGAGLQGGGAEALWGRRGEPGGFKEIEKLPNGFSLLVMNFHENSAVPYFNDCVKSGECPDKQGMVAYYSNRCPYTDYYVDGMLRVLAQEKNIPLKVIKLETREQAQNSPTPATIFSLFCNGKFVTTDLSVCTETKFVKLINL